MENGKCSDNVKYNGNIPNQRIHPTTIVATTIPDSWFQLISRVLDVGNKTIVQHGSFVGESRLEFYYATIHITHPYSEPWNTMLPEIPAHMGIPNPVSDEYIEQYLPHLMTTEKQEGESYTYGSRIWPQVPAMIQLLYSTPNTNQAVLQVARPDDMNLDDPPCLRHIDMRVLDGILHFYPYFRSWDLWCLDEESQILTNSGWRDINTIQLSDLAACFDIENNEITYDSIRAINKQHYQGEMVQLKTHRIDQLITPNHRVLHKYCTHSGSKAIIRELGYTQAKDIIQKDGSYIPLAASWNGGDWSIGEDRARLLGWVLTDSSYRKGCKTIVIYQSDKKYHKEIRGVLSRLEIPFTEYKREHIQYTIVDKVYPEGLKTTMYEFTIPASYAGWIRDLIPHREPVYSLLRLIKSERIALFNSMMQADGNIKSRRNSTSFAFYSMKPERLDWFQLLAFSLGFRTLINKSGGYVSISTKQESKIQEGHFTGRKLPRVNYSGGVWCISTPKTNLVMRRNGKISITGNSGYPANLAAIAILQKYMADEIGVECGGITASSKGLHIYGYVEEVAKIRAGKSGGEVT